MSDDLCVFQRNIGLRRVRSLILESIARKETVQSFTTGVEGVDLMSLLELLNMEQEDFSRRVQRRWVR